MSIGHVYMGYVTWEGQQTIQPLDAIVRIITERTSHKNAKNRKPVLGPLQK